MRSYYIKFTEDDIEMESIVRVADAIEIPAKILRDWPTAKIVRVVDLEALLG